jgi:hypothetical protein
MLIPTFPSEIMKRGRGGSGKRKGEEKRLTSICT